MSDGGLYVAIFELPAACRVHVGRLGTFDLAAGTYLYVGSARRNRAARLARHGRRDKPLRWHIDYLSVRARMLGALLIDDPAHRECDLAAELAERMARPIPGFGASDCRCGGHLFHAAEL